MMYNLIMRHVLPGRTHYAYMSFPHQDQHLI